MSVLQSGHTVKTLSQEDNDRLKKEFPRLTMNCISLNPGGWIFKENYLHYADKIHNFEVRPTDVTIISYPKSGTMWVSELVWTMMANKNFDNKLSDLSLMFRVPAIMIDHLWDNDLEGLGEVLKMQLPSLKPSSTMLIDYAKSLPDPRVIRAHSPLSLLPKNMLDKSKVICIARNPKDVIPSFLHYISLIKSFDFSGDLSDLIDLFVDDKIFFGPFWEFNKECWNHRHHPNFHWIFYEDMKADTLGEIRRLDNFLGTKLGDDKLKEILEYTSFTKMKKRDPLFGKFNSTAENAVITAPKKDGFFRTGKAGGWKNVLTVAQNEKIDAWIKKNSVDTDLRMKY